MAAAPRRLELSGIPAARGGEAPPPGPYYKAYFSESPHDCLGFDNHGDRLVFDPANPLNPLQKWMLIRAQHLGNNTFLLRNVGTGSEILKEHASALIVDPMFYHASALRDPARFEVAAGEPAVVGGIPIRVLANGTPMRREVGIKPWEAENNHGCYGVVEAPGSGGGGHDDAAAFEEEDEAGEGGQGASPPSPRKTRAKMFLCCFKPTEV